jgi:hypothetical protein
VASGADRAGVLAYWGISAFLMPIDPVLCPMHPRPFAARLAVDTNNSYYTIKNRPYASGGPGPVRIVATRGIRCHHVTGADFPFGRHMGPPHHLQAGARTHTPGLRFCDNGFWSASLGPGPGG